MNRFFSISSSFAVLALLPAVTGYAADAPKHPVLTGQAAFTDAAHESPGTRRHLTVADLPGPAPRAVGR